MELLPKALLITAIGMGLVFTAIILLWGLMALLVRLTADSEEENEGEKNRDEIALIEVPQAAVPDAIKVRAAAAAVATALALLTCDTQRRPLEVNPSSSNPWKDAHRTIEINRRSRCFNK